MEKRILVIDDDRVVRHLLRAILEESGYEVLSASTGEEAFQFLGTEEVERISCVILDKQMPGMSGIDVLTKLQLKANTQKLPVIMLTCEDSPDSIIDGYNYGADYYITKPFSKEQILYGVQLVV